MAENSGFSAYLLIGRVLKPQGIKGLVKVYPETDDPERFLDLENVFVKRNGAFECVTVEDVQVREQEVFLRLDGVQDRNGAERQRDTELFVDREHAVELGEDENFICDLIGCTIRDTQGHEIGMVKDVLQPGANDVYVLKTPRGEMLVPALKAVFPTVDVKNRLIVADEKILPQVSVMND